MNPASLVSIQALANSMTHHDLTLPSKLSRHLLLFGSNLCSCSHMVIETYLELAIDFSLCGQYIIVGTGGRSKLYH